LRMTFFSLNESKHVRKVHHTPFTKYEIKIKIKPFKPSYGKE